MSEASKMSWDEFFMRHVYLVASKSKDTRTRIGAVIVRDNRVISEGYNGMPIGVNDNVQERYERPEKYFWFEHGERNAVFACARFGIACQGGVMYTQGVPCADCARAVIQAGIKEVVVHKQWQEWEVEFYWERWIESQKRSTTLLSEGGVQVRVLDCPLHLKGHLDGKTIVV
jgi:dCMP deaminase